MPLRRANVVASPATEQAELPLVDHSAPLDHTEETGTEETGSETAPPPARSSVPAPIPHHAMAPVQAADDDDGFGALDNKIGFGSFPIVKLDKEDFFVGDKKYGKEFFCVVMGAKPKVLYKEAGTQDTEFLFYSYDNVRDISGRSVQDQLREWESKGIKWETKEYMECVVREMVPTDKTQANFTEGKVCLLNVAPASVSRLAGYRLEVKAYGGMSAVITRCVAGDIVSVGKTTFYPWNFEYVCNYS